MELLRIISAVQQTEKLYICLFKAARNMCQLLAAMTEWYLLQYSYRKYCDGFAQSIKVWSQKNPLLGKHVQTHMRPTIQQRGVFYVAYTQTVC
jgi:hypothetical protein